MRRKKKKEPDNLDRWIISYADFITLLFAFFVVMYAISNVNSGKLKVMAAHFDATFTRSSDSFLPTQIGVSPLSLNHLEPKNDSQTQGPFTQSSNDFFDEEYTEISSEFKTSLLGLIDDDKIKFKETDNWIEIEIKASLLFQPGSSRLLAGADKFIEPIALLLNRYNNPVQVEGFTDRVPIQNELYPSNWELSAHRASSVVRRLIDFNVDSIRLAAIGYGSNFPGATNATPRGREANRRVVLLIAKQPKRERLVDLQRRGNLIPPRPNALPESLPIAPAAVEPEQVSSPTTATPEPVRTPGGGLRFSTIPGR